MFVSTVSTYIALNELEILCLYQQSQHACIFGMVGKPWFPVFQNFFWIENPLNINKVMDRNVCMCLVKATNTSINGIDIQSI